MKSCYPPSGQQYEADLEVDVESVQPHSLFVLNEHVNVLRNDKILYWLWSLVIKCDQATRIIRDSWSLYMSDLLNVKTNTQSTNVPIHRASCPDVLGPCAIACMIKWRLSGKRQLVTDGYAIGTALLLERAWHLHNQKSDDSYIVPHEYYEEDIFLVMQFLPGDTKPAFQLSKSCNGDFNISTKSGDLIFFPVPKMPVIIPGQGWMKWDEKFDRSLQSVMQMLGYKPLGSQGCIVGLPSPDLGRISGSE